MDDAAASETKLVLSVISLAEILYLMEKNRLPFSAYERLGCWGSVEPGNGLSCPVF